MVKIVGTLMIKSVDRSFPPTVHLIDLTEGTHAVPVTPRLSTQIAAE